jgi:predicted AlkP superfamily pyrophosphatase or phosphodiesterase
LSKRVLVVVAIAAVAALAAAYVLQPERGVPEGAPPEAKMAGAIGTPVMQHIYNGHVDGRSGDIYLVPKPHSFLLGEWDYETLGTDTPTLSTSHPNPWAYLAKVPMIFYGPGYVPSGQTVDREVDITSLASTYAQILGMDDFTRAGQALDEIDAGKRPPKVIFTLVIDGGGWNALQLHPESVPNLAALREKGTTYVNATIGSAPSITGALHATFGTGEYPRTHGIPGNQMRSPDDPNTTVDTWLDDEDPRYLELPTISDEWDAANGNKPVVGAVAYEGWHLGMLGRGSFDESGDSDVAVVWDTEEESWSTNTEFYDLPDYLLPTDLPRLESYEEALDPRDGLPDGAWFGHTLNQLQEPTVRPGTPAFVRFTGDATTRVFQREGFGDDYVTDLMWVELKSPDYAGHAWNVTGPEEGDVLRETDAQIARFKRLLDESVGRGNYVMAISADHGQQPLPDLHGGWRINNIELQRDIERRFGEDIVMKVTPVDVYFDMDEVEQQNVSLSDVASYLGTYTLGDNVPEAVPGADRVPEGRLDETLFAGAFTGDFIESLTPQDIQDFGSSSYREGTFVRTPASPSPGS